MAHDSAASAKALAANKYSSILFAYALAGLMAVFVVCHFGRIHLHLHQSHGHRDRLTRAFAAPFRVYRMVFLRKLPKFTSGSHLALVLVYLGLNAVFQFWDMEFAGPNPYSLFSKRAGWMATTNSALAFLLAMKNTPLAFLTGYSHERLNVLHRWVGRVIWFWSSVHVIAYSILYAMAGNSARMQRQQQVYGYVSYAAFNIIIVTSLHYIRRRHYELFYMMHCAMFVVGVVFLGLHKPKKFGKAMYGVGAFWCFDRLLRWGRTLYYYYLGGGGSNEVTVIPLPGLATKLVFRNPTAMAFTPGSHAFVGIPHIRRFQTHPFTISSASAVEFVVRAQKGFTFDLHTYALKHPYTVLKASLDGPYGAVPDFKQMNRVVLFAGGSGGAFLFPIAVDIARNAGRCAVTEVEAVWVIKDRRHISWYEDELEELKKSPLVRVSVFVTSAEDPIVGGQSADAEAAQEHQVRRSICPDVEKPRLLDSDGALGNLKEIEAGFGVATSAAASTTGSERIHSSNSSNKKAGAAAEEAIIDAMPQIDIATLPGRPNVAAIVEAAVAASAPRDTVAVAACGPVELMRIARNAVADNISLAGPSVTLHCEQFGWG